MYTEHGYHSLPGTPSESNMLSEILPILSYDILKTNTEKKHGSNTI